MRQISETERKRRADNMRLVNARKPRKDEAYYREFIKARIKVDERGCWLWQKFVMPEPNAYGQIYALGKDQRVHRVAYLLWKGPIPEGKVVCHSCDVKHCCNPDHLWLGTISDNKQDEIKKGLNYEANRTHCPHGHAYTPENTSVDNRGWRHCRTCQKAKEHSPRYIAWRREYQRRRRELKRASRGQLRRSGEP